MRLDVFLAEKGFVRSRTEAKQMIEAGAVSADGRVLDKPAMAVEGLEDRIVLDRSVKKYASRGGTKLEGALSAFSLNVQGVRAIDIGASSGGFTDCLLQNGATSVIALDSGRDQLVDSLRRDPRVYVIEGYNARYLSLQDLPYAPNFAVMDVSFISATYIIPSVYNVLSDGAHFVCLVKPQFEVGRAAIGKGGIVKDEKSRKAALSSVVAFAEQIGFVCHGAIQSPIKGGDGNVEYLAHFQKKY
jgi:23S rRNA (cytidine1920-2'-O)/16S rRNA (cytidine1409-2'-O)-methyltransferase